MKKLLIITTSLLIGSSILHADNNAMSIQESKLNQRLELISKVNNLTDKLNKLKADHLTKMNKYAELIEEKASEFKKLQGDYFMKIKELKSQNQEDRLVFNSELKKQRVCLRDEQIKHSRNLKEINSGYINEISAVKNKYKRLLNDSAEDYQDELTSQKDQYDENISNIKDDFEDKVESIKTELAEFRNQGKIIISNMKIQLADIEKGQKLKTGTIVVAKTSKAKPVATAKQPVTQEKHSYFYRLFDKII